MSDQFTLVCGSCGTASASSPCLVCGASNEVATEELPVGARIGSGRYVVENVLGRGGFGITYRALDTHLQRLVAIKEMFPDGSLRRSMAVVFPTHVQRSQTNVRDQFLREASTLARFRDSAIVQVYEVVQEAGTVYVVMEFLHGETYDERVRQHGPLSQHEVVAVLRVLAGAIARLHASDVLHRDIKPSNVMCSNGQPVLIDFGSARSFLADVSQDMSRIVTPGFSPLEQYAGHARYGPASDVYSLAATGYFLLTGRVPVEPADRLQGTELVRPGALVPVDARVEHAIISGLHIAVRDRPKDPASFMALLDQVQVPTEAPFVAPQVDPRVTTRVDGLVMPTNVSSSTVPPKRSSAKSASIAVGVLAFALVFGLIGFLMSRKPAVVASPSDSSVSTDRSTSSDGVSGDDTMVFDTAQPGDTTTLDDTTVDAGSGAADAGTGSLTVAQPTTVTSSATRSSVNLRCNGARVSYGAWNLFDGDMNTGWGASKRDGTGESVTVRFAQPTHLRRISMTPGFLRDGQRQDQNCAVVNAFTYNRRIVEVAFDFDSTTVRHVFSTDAALQSFDLDTVTSSVTMTILGTERWGSDDETIISELRFEALT